MHAGHRPWPPSVAVYNKWAHKFRIVWEFHGENQIGDGLAMMQDGKPILVASEYTLSLADTSNLRPFLEGWRGRAFTAEEEEGFDIAKLLGVPCMLTIQHNKSKDGQKTYANPRIRSHETHVAPPRQSVARCVWQAAHRKR